MGYLSQLFHLKSYKHKRLRLEMTLTSVVRLNKKKQLNCQLYAKQRAKRC